MQLAVEPSRYSFDDLQRHIAHCAIAPTTLRKMGANRQVICSWFACEADLSILNRKSVSDALDEWSKAIMDREGGPWGAVRKSINLFLRDCALNYEMRTRYELAIIEPFLEIPLDSRTMTAIRETAEAKDNMPRFSWVKDLESGLSDKYQKIAKLHAESLGMLRVELDIKWWSRPSATRPLPAPAN